MATYDMIRFDEHERIPSKKSGVPHVSLSDALGLDQLRANIWYLEPGDRMSYHRQRTQEELYVPLDGPGQIRIGSDLVTVSVGSALRIPPETPRQVRNDSDRTHVWLVVGAPSVEGDGVTIEE